MEQRTDAQIPKPGADKAETTGKAPANGGDPLRVATGPGALRVDNVGEG
jgi:hypothetical protein